MSMSGIARPLASLSSGLLARKGQARPAMRPQTLMDLSATSLEDLGWNDMGGPPPQPVVVPVPAPPPVLEERQALQHTLEQPMPAPGRRVSPATAARIGRDSAKQTAKGKAAFTLRFDKDRHLRLRLAAAVAGRSAQALMIDAFDQFIATMPEVEPLAEQAAKPQGRTRR